MSSRLMRSVLLIWMLSLAGCATTGSSVDPLERYNRKMFEINDTVDRVAMRPAAEIYRTMTPQFVQTGFGNFFGNLADIPTLANNILQGKVNDSLTDFMRIAVNTTFGLAGILDIASEAGLPKHREDFGQTLGKWGVPPGPYVVLPLFGPSTLRDSMATPVDLAADPWAHAPSVRTRNTGTLMRLIDQRAALLDASSLIDDAALDPYEFLRDAYLQRRESLVYDGDVPLKKKYDPAAARGQAEPFAKHIIQKELSTDAEAGVKPALPVLTEVPASYAFVPAREVGQ
jgi:phospholipid-binding lipoprotein MlaA